MESKFVLTVTDNTERTNFEIVSEGFTRLEIISFLHLTLASETAKYEDNRIEEKSPKKNRKSKRSVATEVK